MVQVEGTRAGSRLRAGLIAMGVVVAGLAIGADLLAPGGSSGFGRGQLLLATAGVLLVAAGLLGGRAVPLYKGFALVLVNTAVLLVALEATSALILRFLGGSNRVDPDARYREGIEEVSWYYGRPWAEDFWSEHWEAERQQRYQPFVVWRIAPYTGTHVNVDEPGIRSTPGADCGAGAQRIGVFGGSAVWGWGAPDDETIPAHLQRALGASGIRACVTNYGQNGWVSTQDLIELQRLIAAGEAPDVAIFYNGYNDIGAAAQSGQAGEHLFQNRIARQFEGRDNTAPERGALPLVRQTRTWALIARLTTPDAGGERRPGRDAPSAAEPAVADLADAVVRIYVANYRALIALAREHDFSLHVFWQPLLPLSGKPRTPEEGRMGRNLGPILPLAEAVFARMTEAIPRDPHFHDLRAMFDQDSSLAFIDFVHLTPDANQKVAMRILAELELQGEGEREFEKR
ncbi:MAG: SGNH/GDSL hydrolase family protein [Gemmatimonadetes bacterium]|nr:SGNH/GDSL hydrolase family protein [Gemmatimonadota bacterium]